MMNASTAPSGAAVPIQSPSMIAQPTPITVPTPSVKKCRVLSAPLRVPVAGSVLCILFLGSLRRLGNHRQQQVGRIRVRVMDRVARSDPLAAGFVVLARVQVAIEARKVGAGNLQADAMARREVVTGRVQVDANFVY